MSVEYKEGAAECEEHYFKAIMIGVNLESQALLDIINIKKYLSFIAPVPYSTKFMFNSKIYSHAKEIGETIEEYRIYVGDDIKCEQIFKEYTSRIYTKSGEVKDNINNIVFHDFRDEDNILIAWMWFGISAFDGTIPVSEHNPHKGLRLRKVNIQIGTENTLRKLHKEERGNGYFVGEVFAVHNDLIPNARRDYFKENSMLELFEDKTRNFFIQELYKLYHEASDSRSDQKAIVEHRQAEQDYNEKATKGFSGSVERKQVEAELEKKRIAAEKAAKRQNRHLCEEKSDINSTLHKVRQIARKAVSPNEQFEETTSDSFPNNSNIRNGAPENSKPRYFTEDLMSLYGRKTCTVISRIYDVIQREAPEIAVELITSIQENLKTERIKR